MIETVESREEFEKRRERARAAMKSAIRGELPFSGDKLSAVAVLAEAESRGQNPDSGEVRESTETDKPATVHRVRESGSGTTSRGGTQCPICEERKRKSRERVKRYREKKK